MSRIIASAAIRGGHACVRRAEDDACEILGRHGRDTAVGFPSTAYALPIILALTGKRVERLGDLEEALAAKPARWLPAVPSEQVWLPYLGGASMPARPPWWRRKPLRPSNRCAGVPLGFGYWLGPTTDGILREQGIKLVDGRMPGFAACVGALPDDETAEQLARDLQERNMLVFHGFQRGGETMAAQLNRRGVEMNWETFLVPYGPDTSSIVHALGFRLPGRVHLRRAKPGGAQGNS